VNLYKSFKNKERENSMVRKQCCGTFWNEIDGLYFLKNILRSKNLPLLKIKKTSS